MKTIYSLEDDEDIGKIIRVSLKKRINISVAVFLECPVF